MVCIKLLVEINYWYCGNSIILNQNRSIAKAVIFREGLFTSENLFTPNRIPDLLFFFNGTWTLRGDPPICN